MFALYVVLGLIGVGLVAEAFFLLLPVVIDGFFLAATGWLPLMSRIQAARVLLRTERQYSQSVHWCVPARLTGAGNSRQRFSTDDLQQRAARLLPPEIAAQIARLDTRPIYLAATAREWHIWRRTGRSFRSVTVLKRLEATAVSSDPDELLGIYHVGPHNRVTLELTIGEHFFVWFTLHRGWRQPAGL